MFYVYTKLLYVWLSNVTVTLKFGVFNLQNFWSKYTILVLWDKSKFKKKHFFFKGDSIAKVSMVYFSNVSGKKCDNWCIQNSKNMHVFFFLNRHGKKGGRIDFALLPPAINKKIPYFIL